VELNPFYFQLHHQKEENKNQFQQRENLTPRVSEPLLRKNDRFAFKFEENYSYPM